MRSTAGIVAGLFLVGLFANCGGNDSNSGPSGGSTNASGEGGEGTGKGATGAGGSSSAGKTGTGDAGTPTATGCTKDADCGSNAKCVKDVCRKNDGQACTTADDCQNDCIDNVCTSKLPDRKDCAIDDDCAHTCIDNVCAPPSDVGGDCDASLGAAGAGAGGDGAGGAPAVVNSSGGAGGDGGVSAPQARDCAAPLQCFAGKCLAPDKQACKDNVDCVNTCVNSVCVGKPTLNGKCDDNSDCYNDALVCDTATSTCKLDVKQQCNDNAQCQSDRCICADSTCLTRTCKTATSTCECKWSPKDSASCDANSAPLDKGSKDPNGCDETTNHVCNQGQCIKNTAGDCVQKCRVTDVGKDGQSGTGDDTCGEFQAPGGCNPGYQGVETPNGQCQVVKGAEIPSDPPGDHTYRYYATCQAQCTCEIQ